MRRAAGVHVQDVVQAAMWSSLAVIGWLSLRLPSGALLFWLTSSCCVLGWVRGRRGRARALHGGLHSRRAYIAMQ